MVKNDPRQVTDPFTSDDEFLNYCELHSTTPRALFHSDHVRRLFKLAGEPDPQVRTGMFYGMHDEIVYPLVKSARERLKQP